MASTSTSNLTRRPTAALGALASLLGLLVLGAWGLAPAARAAACSNEAIRQAQVSEVLPDGPTSFPDCMALEMVSPKKKFNQFAKIPAFAAGGERVRFLSVAALADTPKQGSLQDPYIATRTASGWVTEPTSTPPQYTLGYVTAAVPCTFSVDLSRWATWASTDVQGKLAITTVFEGGLGGLFSPLSPLLKPINAPWGPFVVNNSYCQGASSDSSHFFFAIHSVAYGAGDPIPGASIPDGADQEAVYEAYRDQSGTPRIALLARDKDGTVFGGRCGTRVGGEGSRGAVSPDASRVYFSTRPGQSGGGICDIAANKLRIMVRTQTPAGPLITQLLSSECERVSPPCSTVDGDDVYQGASQEGDRVLFTTTRQLADTDKDATADLYLHDSTRPEGERLTELSAGDGTDPTPGEGAEVIGVADFGGDASHTYFVAKGVLTTGANEAGKTAQAGKPNLYLSEYPSGDTAFIGTLDPSDLTVWSNGPGQNTATAVPTLGADPEDQAVGGDGHVLAIWSSAALLAEDADGGFGDEYRYDSNTGSLELISKPAPGGSGNEALGVKGPGAISAEIGPQSLSFYRWISEDGETIVFDTKEALAPDDTNGSLNAYMWHEGELTAIPFGEGPTVSMRGNEVGFTSDERLLPEDGDGSKDVYLLRVGGGFPIITPPAPCVGEACQGPPGPGPGGPGVTSAAIREGNPQRPQCKKSQVRKRGRCVKRPRKARQHKHKRQTSHKQGGQK